MTIREELKEWKLAELKKFASEMNIKGRSKMNAEQLADAIAERLEAS